MTRVFNWYIPTGTLLIAFLDAMGIFLAVLLGHHFLRPASGTAAYTHAVPAALAIAAALTFLDGSLPLPRQRTTAGVIPWKVLGRLTLIFLFALPLLHWAFFRSEDDALYVRCLQATVLLALFAKLVSYGVARICAGKFDCRIMILGVGEDAAAVKEALDRSRVPGVWTVGFYAPPDPAGREVAVPANKILPKGKTIGEITGQFHVNEIVVALRERRGNTVPWGDLVDAKLQGVKVTDLSQFFERYGSRVRLDLLRDSWFVFGHGFRQGLLRTAVKRAFDIVASLVILALALPVMLVAAVLIKLDSEGPVVFRQSRVGYKGRHFDMLKFRSMRNDAERDGKARWAQPGDPRVTRIGRLMRRTRIDELPQLVNVLRGDMSLVGPRPERPPFVEELDREIPYYTTRHSVKPGVTGWAQVRHHYGASVEDAAGKLEYDLFYVKNHTLFFDLYILACSAKVVLTGRGAR